MGAAQPGSRSQSNSPVPAPRGSHTVQDAQAEASQLHAVRVNPGREIAAATPGNRFFAMHDELDRLKEAVQLGNGWLVHLPEYR